MGRPWGLRRDGSFRIRRDRWESRGGKNVVHFVDEPAVDEHANLIPHTNAFHSRPLARRAVGVTAAAKTEYVAPGNIFMEPVEASRSR